MGRYGCSCEMETVGSIPGSWEGLFAQGRSRSELVGFYREKASVCLLGFFWIRLSRRRGQRGKAAKFREEVTRGVNADELGVIFEDGKPCCAGLR